jgi:hypothetical protein
MWCRCKERNRQDLVQMHHRESKLEPGTQRFLSEEPLGRTPKDRDNPRYNLEGNFLVEARSPVDILVPQSPPCMSWQSFLAAEGTPNEDLPQAVLHKGLLEISERC